MKLIDKSDKGKSGIYLITNTVNNKVYVGQSINLWTRVNEGYLQKLDKNKSHNKHLQRAWDKYGKESFTFEVLEYVNFNELNERETLWIQKYESFINNKGYNIIPQGGSNQGMIVSEATREKISNATKGENNPFFRKRHTEETKSYLGEIKSIPIIQLTMDGEIIKEWKSRKEASENYKVSPNAIYSVLAGKTTSCKGFIWIYKTEYEKMGFDKNEHFKKNKINRPVLQFDLDGNFIKEFINMSEAMKETGAINIHKVCKGKLKTSGGFKWSYKIM